MITRKLNQYFRSHRRQLLRITNLYSTTNSELPKGKEKEEKKQRRYLHRDILEHHLEKKNKIEFPIYETENIQAPANLPKIGNNENNKGGDIDLNKIDITATDISSIPNMRIESLEKEYSLITELYNQIGSPSIEFSESEEHIIIHIEDNPLYINKNDLRLFINLREISLSLICYTSCLRKCDRVRGSQLVKGCGIEIKNERGEILVEIELLLTGTFMRANLTAVILTAIISKILKARNVVILNDSLLTINMSTRVLTKLPKYLRPYFNLINNETKELFHSFQMLYIQNTLNNGAAKLSIQALQLRYLNYPKMHIISKNLEKLYELERAKLCLSYMKYVTILYIAGPVTYLLAEYLNNATFHYYHIISLFHAILLSILLICIIMLLQRKISNETTLTLYRFSSLLIYSSVIISIAIVPIFTPEDENPSGILNTVILFCEFSCQFMSMIYIVRSYIKIILFGVPALIHQIILLIEHLPPNVSKYTSQFILLFITFYIACYFFEKEQRFAFLQKNKLIEKEENLKEFININSDPIILFSKQGLIENANIAFWLFLEENKYPEFKDFSENCYNKLQQCRLAEELNTIFTQINLSRENSFEIESDYSICVADKINKSSQSSLFDRRHFRSNHSQTHHTELEINFRYNKKLGEKLLVIIHDKEKIKKLLEEKMSNKFKNNIIKFLSHDLRTPINGILGPLTTLKSQFPNNSILYQETINLMIYSAKLLVMKVDDMLDFSQIESDNFEPNFVNITTTHFVKEIKTLCKLQSEFSKIKLIISLSPETPANFAGDEKRLYQIIIHLIFNSFKFTTDGSPVKFTISKNRDQLKFQVTDQGIGINQLVKKELQALLSGNYYKISKSKISTQTSTKTVPELVKQGFAIAITQKICKELGGEIKFSSIKGMGTTFWFSIPYEIYSPRRIGRSEFEEIKEEAKTNVNSYKSDYQFHREESSDFVCPEIPREGYIHIPRRKTVPNVVPKQLLLHSIQEIPNKHVLIVDDSSINRLVLRGFLKEFMHIITYEALNGQDAVDQVIQNKNKSIYFDIILMDLNMPIMDGMEATRIIKQHIQQETILMLPIVAVTAYDTKEIKEKCFEIGMNDYIIKPVHKEIFIHKLKMLNII